jgi:N-acetylmuramic acid 6-phosphate (MurNAc-6-P) etherase
MVRRLANAIERVAKTAGTSGLGGRLFYVGTGPTTGRLAVASRNAVQGKIYQALAEEFADEIENAGDAALDSGLVQVAADITVSGGNLLGLSVRLAPRVAGFVLSIDMLLSIQE